MKDTVKNIGYTVPTPIQEKSIPELLLGKDLLGQAQTGTGKTAAFSIPLIELVNEKKSLIQALVICPTRELCLQVCKEIQRLSIHKLGLETLAIYGGQAIEQQFRSLKTNRPHIVVATPGRLFDHLRRKSLELSNVRMIVLDEADEMLDMGFRPEIEQIFELLPEENQRIFFSATMPKAINDLVCSYLRNPEIIKSNSKTLTVSTIAQSYFRARGKEKTELLCRVLDIKDPKLAVVFCNAKSTADEIVDEIQGKGFEAGVLHGDLSQAQRDRVMAKFKAGLVRVLVATDVASRGLDIDDVELVINFHLPHDPEDYVHRIGRTGRAGRAGCAVSLVEPRDNSRLRRIAQFARVEISEEQPPTLAQVKAAKIANIFSRVKDVLDSQGINEYRSMLQKQKLSAEDVAVGMLKLALQKFDDRDDKDTVFEEFREKKYTGFLAEKRLRGRNGRENDSVTKRRRERPRNEDTFAKPRGEKSARYPRVGEQKFPSKREPTNGQVKRSRDSFAGNNGHAATPARREDSRPKPNSFSRDNRDTRDNRTSSGPGPKKRRAPKKF